MGREFNAWTQIINVKHYIVLMHALYTTKVFEGDTYCGLAKYCLCRENFCNYTNISQIYHKEEDF